MSARPEKFQLLPELDPESFTALKADIAERGEKRTLARKLNVLRRHLSREQVRDLIGDQLRVTPEWSNNRIAGALGVDDKTVAGVRSALAATSEIPKLHRVVSADGKERPLRQTRPRRQRHDDVDFADDEDDPQLRRPNPWDDPNKQAKFHHAIDLIKLGVDPNSERVATLIEQASAHAIKTPGYRPFAHCTEAGEREWRLFILFLAREWNWNPEHAAEHVEYLSQKQFKDPDEWLGEEGRRFRHGWWPSAMRRKQNEPSDEFKQAWAAFKQENAEKPQAEIIAETEAIYKERGSAMWRVLS
jgi:hypothetical protein